MRAYNTLAYFRIFIDDDIFRLVLVSKHYKSQHNLGTTTRRRQRCLDRRRFRDEGIFWGMCLAMNILELSTLEICWIRTDRLFLCDFPEVMSGSQQIYHYIHGYDELHRGQPDYITGYSFFLESINMNFDAHVLSHKVSIDDLSGEGCHSEYSWWSSHTDLRWRLWFYLKLKHSMSKGLRFIKVSVSSSSVYILYVCP